MAPNIGEQDLEQGIGQLISQVNQTGSGNSAFGTSKYTYIPPEAPEFAAYIDHTLLKLDATPEQINQLCEEAQEWRFKSVCVRVNYVAQAVEKLKGSGVDVCCVVGFHEGTYTTKEKSDEAVQAIHSGATELDFVINYPLLKAREYQSVHGELKALRDTVSRENEHVICKLILETSQLTRDEIIAGTFIAYSTGFDFVKTSTGFMGHGARVEDVQLMRTVADLAASDGQRKMNVKASGGIRSLQDAVTMIAAGAKRLGCSAGVAIMSDKNRSASAAFTVNRSLDKGNSKPGEEAPGDGY